MTANQILCPDCGRPQLAGRERCTECGAIIDPAARAALGLDRRAKASLLADLPLDGPNDAAGWLVGIGAFAAALGFLLPWAPNVIGAGGIGDYVDGWGLATLSHLPVFLAVLAIGILTIIPNRIPRWFTGGLAPIVLGAIILGLSWPYALGPLGTRFGLLLDIAAAIVLVVGGTLRLAPWRHGGPGPAVQ